MDHFHRQLWQTVFLKHHVPRLCMKSSCRLATTEKTDNRCLYSTGTRHILVPRWCIQWPETSAVPVKVVKRYISLVYWPFTLFIYWNAFGVLCSATLKSMFILNIWNTQVWSICTNWWENKSVGRLCCITEERSGTIHGKMAITTRVICKCSEIRPSQSFRKVKCFLWHHTFTFTWQTVSFEHTIPHFKICPSICTKEKKKSGFLKLPFCLITFKITAPHSASESKLWTQRN